MKLSLVSRFTRSVFALGFLALAGRASAAIADFAGSYETKYTSTLLVDSVVTEVFFGRLAITVAATGKATGTMTTSDRKAYSFTTTLVQEPGGSTAHSDLLVVLKGPLPGITLIGIVNFNIHADGSITGSGINVKTPAIGVNFSPESTVKFATFTGKVDSIPSWVGFYTMALTNPDPAGPTVPAGAGYASLGVSKTGVLSYKGKLGDGTILTGSAKPTATGDYSLYAAPPSYLAGGFFSANINLTKRDLQADPALWNKIKKDADKSYPAGFSTTLDVIVQPWLVPGKGVVAGSSLGFAGDQNFNISFSKDGLMDSDYSATLPTKARLTLADLYAVKGAATAPSENNSTEWNKLWKVKLNALTGVWKGTLVVRHTASGKLVTRVLPVEGVMLYGTSINSSAFALGQYTVKPIAGTDSVTGKISFSGPLVRNPTYSAAGKYNVTFTDANDVVSKGTVIIPEDLQSVTVNGLKVKLRLGASFAFGSNTIYANASYSGGRVKFVTVTLLIDNNGRPSSLVYVSGTSIGDTVSGEKILSADQADFVKVSSL